MNILKQISLHILRVIIGLLILSFTASIAYGFVYLLSIIGAQIIIIALMVFVVIVVLNSAWLIGSDII